MLRKMGRWLLTERKDGRNRSVGENGKVVTDRKSGNRSVENGSVVT